MTTQNNSIHFDTLPADLQEIIKNKDRDALFSSIYKPEKQAYNAFQWIGEDNSTRTEMTFIVKYNEKNYSVYYTQWINADGELDCDYWDILWEVYPHIIAINIYLSIPDKSVQSNPISEDYKRLSEGY